MSLQIFLTYEFVHHHTNFLNCPAKLIKIDFAFVHNIEVFELFVYKLLIIYILRVLLAYFVSELFVEPINTIIISEYLLTPSLLS